jgi:hypothetical protein
VVESRKAPKGVPFPLVRASAPSRMSRIEPTTKTAAPSQLNRSSFRFSKKTRTAAATQRATPPAVSASGVTRVRERPSIERLASCRAPRV